MSKRLTFFVGVFCAVVTSNCKDKSAIAPTADIGGAAGEYFKFTIDGKPQQISPDDVSTSYNSTDEEFKVFAGKDGGLSVVLTVPKLPSCPCNVPAGAPPGNSLAQGSVSLQNYPSKPSGFNNWYLGTAGTPAPDAIKISDLGTLANGSRFIAGTISTKVLKTETNGDGPDNVDHVIVGSFRVKLSVSGAGPF
jgi:hypothetical protein